MREVITNDRVSEHKELPQARESFPQFLQDRQLLQSLQRTSDQATGMTLPVNLAGFEITGNITDKDRGSINKSNDRPNIRIPADWRGNGDGSQVPQADLHSMSAAMQGAQAKQPKRAADGTLTEAQKQDLQAGLNRLDGRLTPEEKKKIEESIDKMLNGAGQEGSRPGPSERDRIRLAEEMMRNAANPVEKIRQAGEQSFPKESAPKQEALPAKPPKGFDVTDAQWKELRQQVEELLKRAKTHPHEIDQGMAPPSVIK